MKVRSQPAIQSNEHATDRSPQRGSRTTHSRNPARFTNTRAEQLVLVGDSCRDNPLFDRSDCFILNMDLIRAQGPLLRVSHQPVCPWPNGPGVVVQRVHALPTTSA